AGRRLLNPIMCRWRRFEQAEQINLELFRFQYHSKKKLFRTLILLDVMPVIFTTLSTQSNEPIP
ncbi:hypothetical protein, partial [Janthinobacterium agaricidamnosum]